MVDYSREDIVAVMPRSGPRHCRCCTDNNPFTWRYQRLLDHLADGVNTHVIADRMCIKFRTVNRYSFTINDTVGVSNRYAALALCLGSGWITRCRGTHRPTPNLPAAGRVRVTRLKFEMLPLIGAGATNREIGAHYTANGYRMTTARAGQHVVDIRDAFGAMTRCQLISMLHDYGYVPLPHAPVTGE